MNSWKCVYEPKMVLLYLGSYECPNCNNRVIAFGLDEQKETQPSIVNYYYCPYCGIKIGGNYE